MNFTESPDDKSLFPRNELNPLSILAENQPFQPAQGDPLSKFSNLARKPSGSSSTLDSDLTLDFWQLDYELSNLFKSLEETLISKHPTLVFRDKKDDPDIRNYLDKAYDRIIATLQKLNFSRLTNLSKLLEETHDLLAAIRVNRLGTAELTRLLHIAQVLTNTIVQVMLNNEILRRIVKRYCLKFGRPSFKELLDKDKTLGGQMTDLFYHPRLVTLHFLITYVLQVNVPGFGYGAVNRDPRGELKIDPNDEVATEGGLIPLPDGRLPRPKMLHSIYCHEHIDNPRMNLVTPQQGQIVHLICAQLDQQDILLAHGQIWMHDYISIPMAFYINPPFQAYKAQLLYSADLKMPELLDVLAQSDPIIQESLTKRKVPETYDLMDLWIMLVHTFLFITNVYGLAITAFKYTAWLDLDTTISGIIQGMTPIAATIFGFLLNWWTESKRYYYPHITCQLMLVVSNVLYVVAGYWKGEQKVTGIVVLIIARVLMGMGGARLMTRKYIANTVESFALSKYSAIFVGLTAAGMCLGPGFIALLLFYKGGKSLGDIPIEDFNILAVCFVIIWALKLLVSAVFFKGYNKQAILEAEKLEHQELNMIDFFTDVCDEETHVIFGVRPGRKAPGVENMWKEQVKESINTVLLKHKRNPEMTQKLQFSAQRTDSKNGLEIDFAGRSPLVIPKESGQDALLGEDGLVGPEYKPGATDVTHSIAVRTELRYALFATLILFLVKVR